MLSTRRCFLPRHAFRCRRLFLERFRAEPERRCHSDAAAAMPPLLLFR